MRATFHSGRFQIKDGEKIPFSPKHPDRNFDVSKSDHIDPSLPCGVRFIETSMPAHFNTVEELEQVFYECNFGDHIKYQNEKMIKSRRKDKCKTVEDYRKSTRTCPEETIMQCGKWNNETKRADSVSAEELEEMFWEFVEWHWERYPQAVILDAAVHADEPHCAPHIHMRKVWVANDENGVKCVNQTKALQEMGVSLPDPSKPVDRYNSLKMTYTADCREKWEEIIKSRGYELEDRLEKSKTGLSHEQYIANQIEEKLNKKEVKINEKVSEVNEKVAKLNEGVRTHRKRKEALQRRTEALESKEKQVAEQAKQNERLLQQLQQMAKEINKQITIKNQVASLEDIPDKQRDLPYVDIAE